MSRNWSRDWVSTILCSIQYFCNPDYEIDRLEVEVREMKAQQSRAYSAPILGEADEAG